MTNSGPRVPPGMDAATVSHVVVLLGFVAVAVGVALPWVGETPFRVYVLGMESGLERRWVKRLVLVAGVGLLAEAGRFLAPDRRRAPDLALVAVGTSIAAITAVTGPFGSSWPPAEGVYLTLLGSALLVAGSGISLVSDRADADSGAVPL